MKVDKNELTLRELRGLMATVQLGDGYSVQEMRLKTNGKQEYALVLDDLGVIALGGRKVIMTAIAVAGILGEESRRIAKSRSGHLNAQIDEKNSLIAAQLTRIESDEDEILKAQNSIAGLHGTVSWLMQRLREVDGMARHKTKDFDRRMRAIQHHIANTFAGVAVPDAVLADNPFLDEVPDIDPVPAPEGTDRVTELMPVEPDIIPPNSLRFVETSEGLDDEF